MESLKTGGAFPPPPGVDAGSSTGNGTGEPPTPPHTPQREGAGLQGPPLIDGRPHPSLDPLQQQLQARVSKNVHF